MNFLINTIRIAPRHYQRIHRILPMSIQINKPVVAGTASIEQKRFKIYTRTGDKGSSSLYTGERRAKDDAIFNALGSVDELSSTLGLAMEFCHEVGREDVMERLIHIQCLLQDVNSNVATPRNTSSPERLEKTEFDVTGELAVELEQWIDDYDEQLPPLKSFILPSGGKAASTLHVARTICRRAERMVVPLVHDGTASESTQKYLNRLSDFLFTAARFCAMKEGKDEKIYRKITGSMEPQ